MDGQARDQGVLGAVESAGRVETGGGERGGEAGREGPPAARRLERERRQVEGDDRERLAVPPDTVPAELLDDRHLAGPHGESAVAVLSVLRARRDHGREERGRLVVDVHEFGRALARAKVHGRDPVRLGLVEQNCPRMRLAVRVVPVERLEEVAVGHHGEPVVRTAGEVDRVDGPARPAVDVAVRASCGGGGGRGAGREGP